jgi:hypothetical protein
VPAEVVSGGGVNHACDHGRFEEYVLIKDNHAAYISWDEFERNLKAIANNATGMSSALTRGAAREGELLLPGLLRCGHCGRKLHVHYVARRQAMGIVPPKVLPGSTGARVPVPGIVPAQAARSPPRRTSDVLRRPRPRDPLF